MNIRMALAGAGMLFAPACLDYVGGVEGQIDGLDVGSFSSAALGVIDLEATNETMVLAIFSTAPDACELRRSIYGHLADITTAGATENDVKNGAEDVVQAIVDADMVGEWTVSVTAITDRRQDLQDDNSIVVDTAASTGDDRAFVTAELQNREPEFDQNDGLQLEIDSYSATEGSLRFDLDEDLGAVSIEGRVELRGDVDGDNAGDIDLSGRAVFCQGLGTAFVEFSENVQARNVAPGPEDSCQFANDGECDEPSLCAAGTDTTDCG